MRPRAAPRSRRAAGVPLLPRPVGRHRPDARADRRPRLTRLLSTIFVAHTVSDLLQVAYRAAEDEL